MNVAVTAPEPTPSIKAATDEARLADDEQSTLEHGQRLDTVPPLTIAAAKRGLAIQYGVSPEAIEIVIRG